MQELTTFINSHPLLSAGTLAVFICLTIIELLRARRNVFSINPARVTQLINRENATVIDIRQQDVYKKNHIIDAQSMTAETILKDPKKLDKLRARPVIIVGTTGNDSQKIAALLLKHGYNAYSLSGGMRAWTDAQMPLVGE